MKLQKFLKTSINLTNKLKDIPNGKNKHFTFIFDKNRLLSVGWNNSWKTSPFSNLMGYRFDAIHSEIAAIANIKHDPNFKYYKVVNTRINSLDEIGMAKPCPICLSVLLSTGFKKIWYTDSKGNFCEI